MTTGFEYLTQGNFFAQMLQPFLDIFVTSGMFFAFLLVLAGTLLYIKHKSLGSVGLYLFVMSAVIIPEVEPIVQRYFWVIMFLGLMAVIYDFFRGKG